MSYFFKNGFYHESVHGTKTLQVPDPTYFPPKKLVPDPTFVYPVPAPGEDPPSTPMIEVDDWSEGPVLIEVPNPDCLIPSDAVEVDDLTWRALFEGQALGKRIITGLAGVPELADPLPIVPAALLLSQRIMRARNLLAFTAWFVDMHDLDGVTIPPVIAGARANATAFLLANGETP